MAVWNQINLKDIEYTRFDAEFYHPKYVQELEKWKYFEFKHQVLKLRTVISKPVRTGHTPTGRKFRENDIPVAFIKTNTLREGRIEYPKIEYLPQRCLSKSDYIENEASIVTIIGATKEIVGRVAIKEIKDPPSTTNQNVAIINFKNNIDPYYGMIYLQSFYGRDQLWRHSRQTEQVNLNCREVERILFPNIEKGIQIEIGNIVRQSFQLQDQALRLYKQATDLLEQELGLDKIKFEKPKSYTANFSEIISRRRSDAEFFNTYYDPLINNILSYKYGCTGLKSISNNVTSNVELHKLKFSHFNYIEIGDINVTNGSFEFKIVEKKYAPANAKIKLNGGEVLMSLVRPTRGAISIVPDDLPETLTICSGAFYVFKLKNSLYREITWLYLRIIKNVFEKFCGGTSYPTLDEKYISNFPIPNFDIDFAKKISNLINESMVALKGSKLLLAQAKLRVEQLIEKADQK